MTMTISPWRGNETPSAARSTCRPRVCRCRTSLSVRLAFASLDLHRVQGEVVTDNHRSQRVLERNGFERYGLAPSYLKIAGQWQDCVLFQRIRSDEP